MSKQEEEEEVKVVKRDFKLFGKNISEIPCFRNSFIFGINTGVVGGLVTFLLTSKARLSSHVAFGGMWLGVFAYWIPCRYRYESSVLAAEKLKHALRTGHGSRDKEISESAPSTDQTEQN